MRKSYVLVILTILFSIIVFSQSAEAAWTPITIIEVKAASGEGNTDMQVFRRGTWQYTAPPGLKITGWSGRVSVGSTGSFTANLDGTVEAFGPSYNQFTVRNNLLGNTITFTGQWGNGSSIDSIISNGFIVLSADLPTGTITANINPSDPTIQAISNNAAAAKGMLDGTNNGGKSLAATYDKVVEIKADAQSAAKRIIKVVKGVPFEEGIYIELLNGTQTFGAVTASSTSGSGYTKLSGTLNTVGLQPIVINGKTILFKVVDAPTTAYSAAVSFGN